MNYGDESIDYDSVEDYDITVLAKFNYAQLGDPVSQVLNANQLDNHRKKVKKYYARKNQSIVEQLNLDEYDCAVSYYVPYIEILFDNLSEFEDSKDELIEILNFNEEVENAVINYIGYDEATIGTESSRSNYPFSDALADIGVTDLGYSGNGVKVGKIEGGTPNQFT